MLNQVMLIGRIVRDPVVNTTKEGTAYCRINLAVRRSFKNSEGNYDTDFIDCTAWKKLAETAGDYCTKGSLVCITGRIQMRNYETAENKRMTVSEIIAENITFLHLKRMTQQNDEVPIPSATASNQGAAPANGVSSSFGNAATTETNENHPPASNGVVANN
ncbi:single-stranded DNA-binding protein [Evansella sp. AB-P1]|uniref:single-stranded DNA-binding protein n=1 Tax=Evansella sp. AB-P1 TaxID=3037653 RepID=UPI00241C5B4C|nr:single-stranded DNA-binding protein [Evansella sp. AB-P1]MDG5786656.1 single-stranded DNA-binding protein [Evansella sp. AB-P1]